MNPREIPDEYECASLLQRVFARLTDMVFVCGCFLGLASIPAVSGNVIFLLILLIPVQGYYFFCDGLFSGQGVGKRLFGIRVVDAKTRQPCSVGQAGMRVLVLIVPIMPVVEIVYLAMDGVERLGDKAAKTYVVRVNPKPRPTPVENLRPIDYSRLGQTNLKPSSQNSKDSNG